jgi:hypothetical protein
MRGVFLYNWMIIEIESSEEVFSYPKNKLVRMILNKG